MVKQLFFSEYLVKQQQTFIYSSQFIQITGDVRIIAFRQNRRQHRLKENQPFRICDGLHLKKNIGFAW